MEIHDLLRLSSVPGIGPLRIRALVGHFGSPGEALRARPVDLIRVPGIERKQATAIARHDGRPFADDQLKRLNKADGFIVTWWDERFPELLKRIYDPPAFLYVIGTLEEGDRFCIGVVGTRVPSPYGQSLAQTLSRDLAARTIVTVSGLARGIDTLVHTSTLQAGGRTIAVTGSGLDVPYPPENERLMVRIAQHGAVLSEVPMGGLPDPPNFPKRNRIISGISLGTVVVESAEDGGAMITASTALDQNREVFAYPGNVMEKRCSGPNKLIQEGRAKLIRGVDDVLVELKHQLRPLLKQDRNTEPLPELSMFERAVLDVCGADAVHIDALSERTQLSTSDTLVTLLSLEFKGLVRQLPGKLFLRVL